MKRPVMRVTHMARGPALGAAMACAMLLVLAIAPAAVIADAESLRRDVEQLKVNQAQLRQELAEIRRLLQAQSERSSKPAPEPVTLALDGITFIGDADAPVTVIEFTDIKCPFCQRHARNTLPLLREHYIATGKLRYGIREFPAESLHPGAEKVAEGLLCAGDQGKYWDLRDQLLSDHGRVPDLARVPQFAPAAGLDMKQFQACVSEGKYRERVREDVRLGSEFGVSGTPTFYLGRSPRPEANAFTATHMLRGAQPYPVFKETIESLNGSTEAPGEQRPARHLPE